ncbi:hypothetical protein [Marininema halotolerans]|uniref:Uncharacterized protein n=1 Tax=Marininema halotolerans TaxID=1155944 RepID=A0A1I6NVG5_9BACL|nr:hypothetical protein [Marininema halotolerans]SFS31885.1 hypothetical protein SAMN05444972_101167 [Marininema halotolerans]
MDENWIILLLVVSFFLIMTICGGVLWIKPMKWGKTLKIHNRMRASLLTIVALFLCLGTYGIITLNGIEKVTAMMGANPAKVEKPKKVKLEITNSQFETTHDQFVLTGKVDPGTEVRVTGTALYGEAKVESDGTFSYTFKTKRMAYGSAQYQFMISAYMDGKVTNSKTVVITRKLSSAKEQAESTKELARLDKVNQTIDYKVLLKDANDYTNIYTRRAVKYQGQIQEIHEAEVGTTVMILAVTKDQQGKWINPIIVRFFGQIIDKAKGDLITIYGKVGVDCGLYCDRKIPEVNAIRMR